MNSNLPSASITPPGADGSVEGAQGPYPVSFGFGLLLKPKPDATLSPQEIQSRAQAFCVLCHMSVLFGLPMFVIPMLKRDHDFSLHHAKASAINFIVFHVAMLASIYVHPYLLAAVLLSYVPGWAGIFRAARGERVGWIGFGPIAERVFFMLQAAPQAAPKALPAPQAAPLELDP